MGTAERALVDEEYRGLRGKGFIDSKIRFTEWLQGVW